MGANTDRSGNVWCDPDRPGVPVNPQNVWAKDSHVVTRLGSMFAGESVTSPAPAAAAPALPAEVQAQTEESVLRTEIRNIGRTLGHDPTAMSKLRAIAEAEYQRPDKGRKSIKSCLGRLGIGRPGE